MTSVDVHQHLWPQPFTELLARRRRPPQVIRRPDGWMVQVDGEPETAFDRTAHDPALRAEDLARQGVERALVCNSSPLGIEALPPDEAEPLLAAYNDGVLALDERFGAWGAVGLSPAEPCAVHDLLDRGAVGVSLPAGALATRLGLARCAPVLEALERRSAPLLVHPGPSPWGARERGATDAPAWWPAMTCYVAQMNAAWHVFVAWGRPEHPRLRVLFAMLAGGAPLHLERLSARGGPSNAAIDPLIFFDTSSYGARAIDAVIRCMGIDQLVHGSDRPVVSPVAAALGDAVDAAMRETNPARLLGEPAAAASRPAAEAVAA
jgi:hypothetical protein